jgi:hypothetical protein
MNFIVLFQRDDCTRVHTFVMHLKQTLSVIQHPKADIRNQFQIIYPLKKTNKTSKLVEPSV